MFDDAEDNEYDDDDDDEEEDDDGSLGNLGVGRTMKRARLSGSHEDNELKSGKSILMIGGEDGK